MATLVARKSSPGEIFGAVADEARRVLRCEAVGLLRFEPDESATLVAQSDTPWNPPPLGTRFPLDGENVVAQVLRTGRVARVDDWTGATGSIAAMASVLGVRSAVAAPVIVEGSLWGSIIAASSQSEPLPAETESRVEQFTGLVATAIDNADAHGALSRLAEEQAALRRVAVLVAQQPSPEEVFTAVTEAVGPLLGADLSAMHVFRGDRMATVVASWSGAGPTLAIGTELALDGDSAVARIFHTGETARIDDYGAAEGETAEVARGLHLRSAVGAPILVGGKLWGALMAARRGEEPLPEDAEARIAAFTELVATAVSNAQAREDLQQLANEQAALRRIATLVAGGAEPEQVFAAVAEETAAAFNAVTAVLRFEHDPPAYVVAGISHETGAAIGTRHPLVEGLASTAVYRTGRPARRGAVDWETRSASVGEALLWAGVTSAVASPIVVERSLWGVLTLNAERELPPDTEQRLEKFTELVTTAIANAEARVAVRAAADEQGALRRVATLVAASAAPSVVFAAVTHEIALVLGADASMLCRVDPDGAAVVVGTWADGSPEPAPGTRIPQGGTNLITIVLETGHSARIESYAEATGDAGAFGRAYGLRSAVGAPILVEGRLWGLVVAGTTRAEPLPPDAEERLAGFTELVATAIANTQSQGDLTSLAEQQAALRRVATLVARRATPEVVFRTVAAEAGRLLRADLSALVRIESDDTVTMMAGPQPVPHETGERLTIDPTFVVAAVRQTGRPARFETDDPAAEGMPEIVRSLGLRSAVASPIVVEGAIWGAVILGSLGESFPPETEERLDEFTELVATGISNASARAELLASRARIVAAGDEARRRIQRNLHDGTQQQLVSLGYAVRAAEAAIPPERDDLRAQLSDVANGLVAAVEDLQEISRGIHPAVLSRGGLGPALRALARRSAIPVDLEIGSDERFPEPIEVAAYFVASEALANAAKHSQASRIGVSFEQRERSLLLSIGDDGVGGANAAHGSGLVGLTDRVEALGGSIRFSSRLGEGTRIAAEFPRELELPQPAG